MYNFVLVVVLLVFVAFFSFHMDKSALGDRLGLTLTIVLGLNVFQIVIIDNMPATGYLTNMHSFLLVSTEIVMAVAIENLVVYTANKRRARMEAVALAFSRSPPPTSSPSPLSQKLAEIKAAASKASTAGSEQQAGSQRGAQVEMSRTGTALLGGGSAPTAKVEAAASPLHPRLGPPQQQQASKARGPAGGDADPRPGPPPAAARAKKGQDKAPRKAEVAATTALGESDASSTRGGRGAGQGRGRRGRRWRCGGYGIFDRLVVWVDDWLDGLCFVTFPFFFALVFANLVDKGEEGELGVVIDQCEKGVY